MSRSSRYAESSVAKPSSRATPLTRCRSQRDGLAPNRFIPGGGWLGVPLLDEAEHARQAKLPKALTKVKRLGGEERIYAKVAEEASSD
jgi:hypothetical protein